MSKRRKFSAEFKRGAVEQASQPGVSCAQVARELGIRDTLLTRWKREAQSQGAVAFGGAGTPRDEEMARLKRELARIKKERDFWDQSRSVWNRSCLSPTWAARFPDGSSLHTSIGSESAMGGGFGGFPAV